MFQYCRILEKYCSITETIYILPYYFKYCRITAVVLQYSGYTAEVLAKCLGVEIHSFILGITSFGVEIQAPILNSRIHSQKCDLNHYFGAYFTILRVDFHSKNEVIPNMTPKRMDFHS